MREIARDFLIENTSVGLTYSVSFMAAKVNIPPPMLRNFLQGFGDFELSDFGRNFKRKALK